MDQTIKVLGQATVQLTYRILQTVNLCNKRQLLGLPEITALQLLIKVDNLQSGKVQQSFLKLFQGTGTLKRDYQIQLKPDAKPYALYILCKKCSNTTLGGGSKEARYNVRICVDLKPSMRATSEKHTSSRDLE